VQLRRSALARGLLPAMVVYQLDVASLGHVARAASKPTIRIRVARTIVLLGCVSCLTDISSEMVASVLPIYLLLTLQFSPLQFGIVDGLYQSVSAIARLASGLVADRWSRHKPVAVAGYAMSALCKLGMLVLPGNPATFGAMVAIDRTGKGVRTAPRDAMISLSARPSELATGFGVHRAFDTAGVVVGPLLAFLVLRSITDGFSVIFALSLAFALLGLAVLGLLVSDPPREAAGATPSLRTMLSACVDARLRAVLTTGALLNATVMGDAFLYVMLQRQSQTVIENLPLFYVITSIGFLALAVPVGRLADRYGRVRVYLAGHAAVAVVYAVVLTTPLHMAGITACLLLYGAYYAATDGVLAAIVGGVVPRDVLGSSLGAVGTATSLARLCGSIALGALWTWKGPQAALGAALAATMLVVGVLGKNLLHLDTHSAGA
jgi:MFS family permease